MEKSKVLLVGLGRIGRVHSKYLAKNNISWEYYDLSKVDSYDNYFSGNLENLDQYGFSHVLICTPEGTHYDMYSKIKKGFSGYFLIEKPVVLSEDRLQIFEDEKVYAGMVERFNPAIDTLKANLELDKVISVDFTRCSAAPLVLNANIMEDIGIHDIDLFTELFLQKEPGFSFNFNVLSKTYYLMLFNNSLVARFIWSKETFFKERKIIVRQTDSTFMVDLQEQTVTKHYLDENNKNIVENLYVEKSSPIENQLTNFVYLKNRVYAMQSHKIMFSILNAANNTA